MSDETWGISGPAFLGLFAGAAVVALIVALVTRRVLARGELRGGWDPSAEELAYFAGGPRQAVLAALAGLRVANVITTYAGGTLAAVGRPPAAPSALTWAVYQAAERGAHPRALRADPTVQPVLANIRDTLISRGWLLPPGRRALIRLTSLLVFAVAALGLVRILAGLANDKPVGLLIFLTIVVGLAGLPLLAAPTRAREAERAVSGLRARNFQLDPRTHPAMAAHGAAGAALAVGLFGATALWAADPALAAEADAARSTGGGSVFGGDGGSSDGGGGGGGGGGCGGGGGGCGG